MRWQEKIQIRRCLVRRIWKTTQSLPSQLRDTFPGSFASSWGRVMPLWAGHVFLDFLIKTFEFLAEFFLRWCSDFLLLKWCSWWMVRLCATLLKARPSGCGIWLEEWIPNHGVFKDYTIVLWDWHDLFYLQTWMIPNYCSNF